MQDHDARVPEEAKPSDSDVPNQAETPCDPDAPLDNRKIPLPLKIFGILCLIGGIAVLPLIGLLVFVMVEAFQEGMFSDDSIVSNILFFAQIGLMAALTILFIILGARLMRNKRRGARQVAEVLMVLVILIVLCDMMLFGLNEDDIFYAVIFVILIALSSYIDPSLAEERELQRKLRLMEDRSQAELGDRAGRDLSGEGFITLNFFNIFWIFVVCCVIGLILETIYHFMLFGGYEDRAGLLFGPFSPIYGFGAVLMTVALNRFHDKPIIIIFLVSAVIGGAFEYLTSWFMQFAFGIIAWDYSGTWLSIDGRTNGMFMIMWGCLGVVWIKLLLPQMLKIVNLIPWNWRYIVTTVAAALMITNGVMTLMSLDCWYEREAGRTPDTPVEQFFADHFDNEYMEHRFQSMSIDPDNATRTER
ncbi:putative ABC transporter permease [Raoultibacter massiliensis]|uniref:putative ABC transporter permease n=1 Tax=Raoultibacter massiliensis TaxID=1852371 RepID=UPI000C84148B|nr:putative ABC transporter permease [Raoultibacter massiliensis]